MSTWKLIKKTNLPEKRKNRFILENIKIICVIPCLELLYIWNGLIRNVLQDKQASAILNPIREVGVSPGKRGKELHLHE